MSDKPNFEKLDRGLYVCRTQAGFKKAAIDIVGDTEDGRWTVKHIRGYPTSYPSVVSFSFRYEGFEYLCASCIHVNEYIKDMKARLQILEQH